MPPVAAVDPGSLLLTHKSSTWLPQTCELLAKHSAHSHVCTLFAGGDVGNSTVHMLHGKAGLPGSRQVVQGVHLGGFEAAKSGVHNGRLESSQFRCAGQHAVPD